MAQKDNWHYKLLANMSLALESIVLLKILVIRDLSNMFTINV